MATSDRNVLKEAIILTFDFVGSTKISANLDFEQTSHFYQTPLNILTEVIEDHCGVPWKYVGDQIIVLYNVEEAFPPKANMAFKCAERLIKVSNAYIRPILSQKGIDGFSIRVAIDAGLLVPIAVKRGHEIIPDLVGLTINRLAKIASEANPNQILVGEEYYRLVHGSIQDRFSESQKELDISKAIGCGS